MSRRARQRPRLLHPNPLPQQQSRQRRRSHTDAASAAKEPPTTLPDAATPAPEQNASCNTSLPSRLSVGQTARVVQRLNMRSDASITAAILQTNPTGTQVEIIGGPVCTPVGRVPTCGGKSALRMARRVGRQNRRSNRPATSSNPFNNRRDVLLSQSGPPRLGSRGSGRGHALLPVCRR